MKIQEAILEVERRKREDPLALVYKPHAFQQRIHRSRNKITLVLGGNRTGKTYAAIAEALIYCLGRNTYAEVPEPPNTVWYVVPTSSVFTSAVEPILSRFIPWSRVVRYDSRSKIYRFDNGSLLQIKTSDQRQKRLVAADVDLVVADEPTPKAVFEELLARTISSSGRILHILTPVSEKIDEWLWVRDELYVPWRIGERKDIDVIHMPAVDEDGRPAVPHLTAEQIAQMESMYPDPETRAARIYGSFVVRGGLVFSNFDKQINCIPRFEIPENWHRWLVCDPQYYRFAVLMFAADENGSYYVTDEYYSTSDTIAHRAEVLKAKLGNLDRQIAMYVDYANPQDIHELNYHMSRLDVPVGAIPLPIKKSIDKMILRAHAMIEADPNREYHKATGLGGVYGAPRLLIFDDIQSTFQHDGRTVVGSRLLWEIDRLTWGRDHKPNKISAGGADMVDCLVYGCSIISTASNRAMADDWKKSMPLEDAIVWEAIERFNRKLRDGVQYPI